MGLHAPRISASYPVTVPDSPPRLDAAHASRRKHPGRWLSAALALALVAQLVQTMVTNERFGWPVVATYLFDRQVLGALVVTLWLTALAMVLGIVLGVLLAICRISHNPVLRTVAGAYIWFFRGTPLLVQLIFFYNISALMPQLTVGIPFGPDFFSVPMNTIVTPLLVAILGLGLHEAAYMAEIVRGGLLSVDPGQSEAGQSLGMTGSRIMRRIILPQAMRFIIPPTGNQVISMVKATSLVSVIAMADLFYTVQAIYNRTFEIVPLLLVAATWYLIVTTLLNVVQAYIERYYARGAKQGTTSFWTFFLGAKPWRRGKEAPTDARAADSGQDL
jgi:polar amino acid transport system permease protein